MKKLLLICLLILACEEKYAQIYAELNLDEATAASVIEYLQENKYEYKLEKDKHRILVLKRDIYEISMALARKGLPRIINGKNPELIEHTLISITDLLQKTEYRQAVEGYLARSLETLSEVEKAMVSVNKDTTATVIVKLRPNKELLERQINNIQHLVESAVAELKARRVRVLDSEGCKLIKEFDPYEYNPTKRTIRSCGSSCGDGEY